MSERNSRGLTPNNPWWLGDPEFHKSHQSNLYRKDPIRYSLFSSVGADLPYLWPQENLTFKAGTVQKLIPA